MRRADRGFSLVELIVVVGIIAFLAAILVPALSAARRQATMVVCSSNIRQITLAAVMHTQEHRGYLPLAGEIIASPDYGAGLNRYASSLRDPSRSRYTYAACVSLGGMYVPVPITAALAPYMGIKDLPYHDWHLLDQVLNQSEFPKRFNCPAADVRSRKSDSEIDLTLTGQGTMMSLAYAPGSAVLAWSSNSDFAFNEGAFGFHQDRAYASRRLAGNLNRLRHLDRLVLFTDGKNRSTQAYSWMRDPWICWTPGLYTRGAVTLADAFSNNGRAVDRSMFDVARHQGRMAVGFADGHVESLGINSAELKGAYLLPQ